MQVIAEHFGQSRKQSRWQQARVEADPKSCFKTEERKIALLCFALLCAEATLIKLSLHEDLLSSSLPHCP